MVVRSQNAGLSEHRQADPPLPQFRPVGRAVACPFGDDELAPQVGSPSSRKSLPKLRSAPRP